MSLAIGCDVQSLSELRAKTTLLGNRAVLTERPPGTLVSLDGVALAAAVYYPLLLLVL